MKQNRNSSPAETGPKGPVTIQVDGKSYELVHDFNLLVKVEEECGRNLLAARPDAGTLRAMLYAHLLTKNPAMTLEAAGKLIRPDTIEAISEAIASLG